MGLALLADVVKHQIHLYHSDIVRIQGIILIEKLYNPIRRTDRAETHQSYYFMVSVQTSPDYDMSTEPTIDSLRVLPNDSL